MFDYDIFVQGVPGKSDTHGGLGWSSITLLTNNKYKVIIDTGSFGVRKLLFKKLQESGLSTKDITHVFLTHTHWDHSVNWTLFPNAEIIVSKNDMKWALEQPAGMLDIPELYIKELNASPRLKLANHMEEVLPSIIAHETKGHTPGHFAYQVDNEDFSLIFSGDAIKNKSELVSRNVDMTLNLADSKSSIKYLWKLWKARNSNILIPGHDLPMKLINDVPKYTQDRNVDFQFWLTDDLEAITRISL